MERLTLEDVKVLADRLLSVTHKIVEGRNKYKSRTFARIVEAVYRRDYLTLYTIRKLADGTPEELTAYGSSCMDLSRRVFEDLISLTYMDSKGKNKMAKRFRNFLFVEDKNNMDYLEAAGSNIDKQVKKEILKKYKRVKKEFIEKGSRNRWNSWLELIELLKSKGLKIDRELKKEMEGEFDNRYPKDEDVVKKSWAGLDVESMILMLHRNGTFPSKDEVRTMLQTYKIGNSKNHFSPTDLINFLYEKSFETSNTEDMRLSLLLVTMNLTGIAKYAIRELDFHNKPSIKREVNVLWKDILKLHLKK